MSFLPDMTNQDETFIEGLVRPDAAAITRVKRRQPSERLSDLIQPPEKRTAPDTREHILVKEDEELVQWERVVRQFLYSLSATRAHRITPEMVWAYATNITDPETKDTGYRRDLRRIRKVLRAYFGASYQSTIRGIKYRDVWKVRSGFLVYRKAPFTMTVYLEWKQGLRTY